MALNYSLVMKLCFVLHRYFILLAYCFSRHITVNPVLYCKVEIINSLWSTTYAYYP